MQIPQIRLHQTFAQIGLRITQPVQEIQQKPADLSIQQIPAKLTIEKQNGHLEINQDEAWNQLNVKDLGVFSSDMAEYAKQKGLEAIAEIAEEGNQLAAIEKKGNPIAAISADKATPPPADFNIGFIPSNGSVKIHYTPTEIHVNWKQGGAEIQSTSNKPTHNYIPGKTEVYLRQMQQLDIDFVGVNVNKET